MTREERKAAGWTEWWGVYDWEEREWQRKGGWRDKTGPRRRFSVREDAASSQSEVPWRFGENIGVRHFWRRKKPKAPPPLAVGDEVRVTGVVRLVHYDTPYPQVGVQLDRASNEETPVWFEVSKVERCKP